MDIKSPDGNTPQELPQEVNNCIMANKAPDGNTPQDLDGNTPQDTVGTSAELSVSINNNLTSSYTEMLIDLPSWNGQPPLCGTSSHSDEGSFLSSKCKNKRLYINERNRLNDIRSTPLRDSSRLALAQLWNISDVSNTTSESQSDISVEEEIIPPTRTWKQSTLSESLTGGNPVDFINLYSRMRFDRETNILACSPILDFNQFIHSVKSNVDHVTKVAKQHNKSRTKMIHILRLTNNQRLLSCLRIWEHWVKKTNSDSYKPIWFAAFDDIKLEAVLAFERFISTADKLPTKASSQIDNLDISYNMIMLEFGQMKIVDNILSKKLLYDTHKMVNLLVARRNVLNRIHNKLDTKRVYDILCSEITNTVNSGQTAKALHRHIICKVWGCIESETKHTKLCQRADEGGDVPKLGNASELMNCSFIDHHSNFILHETINKWTGSKYNYRSKLPTPILANHNPKAVDTSATAALNKSLRTQHNYRVHINLDNVQGISTKMLFVSLHKLLNDQPISDELASPFRIWVADNIKCTKITGQVAFLQACLKSKIIPTSILSMLKLNNWKGTQVQPEALLLSVIRGEILRLRSEKLKLDKAKDANWLNWSNRLKNRPLNTEICIQMHIWNIIATEQNFKIHLHKFNKRSQDTPHFCGDAPPSLILKGKHLTLKYKDKCDKNHFPFTLNDYLNKMRLPCCPTLLWKSNIAPYNLLNAESNVFIRPGVNAISMENEYVLKPPEMSLDRTTNMEALTTFLSKVGKNFAIPNLEEGNNEILSTNLKLDRTRYGLRWKHLIEANKKAQGYHTWDDKVKLYIPFTTNRVKMPPKTDRLTEGHMEDLREQIHKSNAEHTNNKPYRKEWLAIKSFLTKNKLVIVGTDKTGMNKLVPYADYLSMGLQFLETNKGYSRVVSPNTQSITLDINNVIVRILKIRHLRIPQSDIFKLKRHNCHPSKFYYLIKDHKPLNTDGNWPIRPIASIHGTPMDGVDWLLSTILQQGLTFVQAHLLDADQVMKITQDLNKLKPIKGWKRQILSLDVVNLYPSIPIKLGIQIVIQFLRDHIDGIELYGIPLSIIEELLELIFNNYHIDFEDNIFKQTEGAPMGARTSVAFSIICMNHIESLALGKIAELTKNEQFSLLTYKRYIDDTLIVFDHNSDIDFPSLILDEFNSILNQIQFTMEKPGALDWMPFLNTQLRINNRQHILAKWYQKPTHSGNLLSPFSNIANKSKLDFLKMTFVTCKKRCNHTSGYLQSIEFIFTQLLKNGYTQDQIRSAFRISLESKLFWRASTNLYIEHNKDKLPLKLPFTSNHTNRMITASIKEKNLPITLVNDKVIRLNTLGFKKKPLLPPCNKCIYCTWSNKPGVCCYIRAVYRLTCTICNDEYIGMTNRLIKNRMYEHANDMRTGLLKFGPGKHLRDRHANIEHALTVFNLDILYRSRNTIETGLSEKRFIKSLNPVINRIYRREERSYKDAIYKTKSYKQT